MENAKSPGVSTADAVSKIIAKIKASPVEVSIVTYSGVGVHKEMKWKFSNGKFYSKPVAWAQNFEWSDYASEDAVIKRMTAELTSGNKVTIKE